MVSPWTQTSLWEHFFSTAPTILLSSLYIITFILPSYFRKVQFSSQRHSLLSILRISEFCKRIPANNAGSMGLIDYFQLSETGCQSRQSCISIKEVEHCVVRKSSYKCTHRHKLNIWSFLIKASMFWVIVHVCFWRKLTTSAGTPPNLFSHVNKLWNGLYLFESSFGCPSPPVALAQCSLHCTDLWEATWKLGQD